MKEPITITLYDNRGRRWTNWLARMGLFAFLAFCIWLSQGSTWWTFVTGVLFLLTFFLHMAQLARTTKTDFRSLDELQVWLDRQKVIEALPPGEFIVDPAHQEEVRRATIRNRGLA